jgi:replication initiation protein RepC
MTDSGHRVRRHRPQQQGRSGGALDRLPAPAHGPSPAEAPVLLAAQPAEPPPLRLTVPELLTLAPRLQTYLTTPRPDWRDIVDAADWLRGEMGISRALWGEACLAMGRECAMVAVALVSARPAEHFRTSPGGYFHGMVAKAKAGELPQALLDCRSTTGTRRRNSRRCGPLDLDK